MANFANPMGYYCAPNGATPDYIATSNFEDFIAYGLLIGNITGEDLGGCNELDTYTVREDFLNYMEDVVKWYSECEPGTLTNCDPSIGVNIGCLDEGTDETLFDWNFYQRDSDGALAISLRWVFMPVSGQGYSDEKVIWLNPEALEDKDKVKSVFDKARAAIEQYKHAES